MPQLTPSNIRARLIALWSCCALGAIAVTALGVNAALLAPHNQSISWQSSQEHLGAFLFEYRNHLAIFFLLTLFTAVMHLFRKEFRIPGIVLAVVSIATLLLGCHGGIRSDF